MFRIFLGSFITVFIENVLFCEIMKFLIYPDILFFNLL
tara:strand:+ start:31992 stop:32105 length:114 start_codon:yes stop_codon:yes gene_type:complete